MTPETHPLVLCVDDDRPVLGALRRLMRREPYTVVTIDQPAEALEFVRRSDVRLIISDMRMPAMSGEELIRAARRWAPDTPSILLTAYPEAVSKGALSDLGVRKLVSKPWDDGDLLETVQGILGRPAPAIVHDRFDRGVREVVVQVDCAGQTVESVLEPIRRAARCPEGMDRGVAVVLENRTDWPVSAMMPLLGEHVGVLERTAGPSRRLLVLEPDPNDAEILSVVLRALGHVPETACTGGDAIERLESVRFDAVLMDLSVSPDEAFDIMERLIARQPWVPAVLIAEEEDPWRRMTFPWLGVRRCMAKPYAVAELREAIEIATRKEEGPGREN